MYVRWNCQLVQVYLPLPSHSTTTYRGTLSSCRPANPHHSPVRRNEEDNDAHRYIDADARAALLNILQVPDDLKPNSIITTAKGATLTRLQHAVISQKTYANVPRKYHMSCLLSRM